YMTNPPSPMAPTRGGAPSGWVSSELRISPIKVQEWNGHYSPGPVIYLRLSDPQSTNHIAVRLHDDQGRWWTAKPEPEGDADGIMPYLVSLPPEVQSVTPEIVLLKPVRAEFMVNIPPPGNSAFQWSSLCALCASSSADCSSNSRTCSSVTCAKCR